MAKERRKTLAVGGVLCAFFLLLLILVNTSRVGSIEDYTPVTEEGVVTSLVVTDIEVTGTATIATAVISTNTTTDTAISAATLTLTGTAALNGGFTVDSTAFIVANTSGNITGAGTLDIAKDADFAGTTEFGDNTCTITDATGAIETDDNLTVGGDITGAGTIDISGAAAFDGGIACDTNKFTVANATGNVLTAGTVTVTGESTFNSHANLGAGDDLVGSSTSDLNMDKFDVAGSTGNIVTQGTIVDSVDDVDVNDSFTVSGIAVFEGTVEFADNTCTITDATGAFETDASVAVGTSLTVATTTTLTGVATLEATAVFSGGQTRYHTLTGNEVTVDGSTGPTLGVLGTSAQSQMNVWQFDADGSTGDDHVFLRWRVPAGYVVGSARLNFTYSYSTAESDGDDVDFDFTVLALTPGTGAAGGTAWDAAGTAGAHLDVDLVNGDGDEGKLIESQINIEITAIAVGDEAFIDFWVDESACDLNASGTVDVHQFEIEWESTE